MQKKIIINGMGCGSCIAHVKDALKDISGVTSVEVNLSQKNAVLNLAHDVSDETLIAAINGAGYEVIEVEVL